MALGTLVPRGLERSLAPRHRHLGLSELDRWFDELWRGFGVEPVSEQTFAPRVDIRETEDEVRVVADLPGLDEKDVDVSLEGDVLTLRGHREEEKTEGEEGERGWHRVQRYRGSFERSFRLPFEVDPEAVKASYRQGVLTVVLPKPVEEKPRHRQIPVTSA